MEQRRMLVVDDSLTSRTLVNLSLKGLNWQVLQAETGFNGLSVAKSLQPDVILLDYMLPDMNGNRFCQTLLHEANTQQIPVIVISGKQEGLVEAFAGCSNVHHFLPKPFSKEQIQQALADLYPAPAPAVVPASALPQGSETASLPSPDGSLAAPASLSAQVGQAGANKGLPPPLLEQLGKQLYQVYKPLFEQSPTLLQGQEPVHWPGMLARKWVTPALVQSLWQAWLPWYQQQAGGLLRVLCIGNPEEQLLKQIPLELWEPQRNAKVQYCPTPMAAEALLSQGWDWLICLDSNLEAQGLATMVRLAALPSGQRPWLGCLLPPAAPLPTWQADVIWMKSDRFVAKGVIDLA